MGNNPPLSVCSTCMETAAMAKQPRNVSLFHVPMVLPSVPTMLPGVPTAVPGVPTMLPRVPRVCHQCSQLASSAHGFTLSA
eukprot:scaffold184559_cov33-Tisochrysis_lutea.AAC.2